MPTSSHSTPAETTLCEKEALLLPSISIGICGHVAHGKSTLIKSLTGVRTQKHSKEKLNNGSTIKLGYANAKLWQCDEHPDESTTSTASTVKSAPDCALCDGAMRCVRHVSFVDCPGHSVLMTRMLSGASAMDAAIVVIAANLPCPQPQTFEHVAALQALGISNVFVVQNKVDLVDEAAARENLLQIRSFLKGTLLEDAPVVPMSAQRGWNLAYLLQALLLLREPKRHALMPARITVIRSFCVNKCGCTPEELRGGVAGGILVQGTVRVGDQLDIVPGLLIRQPDQSIVCKPLSTTVLSIFSDQTELDHAMPGGLYGLGLTLDSTLTKDDRLAGQVMGAPGTLPPVHARYLYIVFTLFPRIAVDVRSTTDGHTHKMLSRNRPLESGQRLLLNTGGATEYARVVAVQPGGFAKLELQKPLAAATGDRVCLSRCATGQQQQQQQQSGWRLIGSAFVSDPNSFSSGVDLSGKKKKKQQKQVNTEQAPENQHDREVSSNDRVVLSHDEHEREASCHCDEHERKASCHSDEQVSPTAVSQQSGEEPALLSLPSYECMLASLLSTQKTKMVVRPRLRLPPVEVFRVGSRKFAWANVGLIASLLHRDVQHLIQFVLCALSADGTVNAQHQLIFRARVTEKMLYPVLKRYIVDHLRCMACNQTNTVLKREVESARSVCYIVCSDCGAMRQQPAIVKGYRAVGRRRQ